MGISVYYTGSECLYGDAKTRFARQAVQLLNAGGMMRTEYVSMFGKELTLIDPVKATDEPINFQYNYFEDNFWENAYFDPEKGMLLSGKVGGAEFNDVMTAVYILKELCDENSGLVINDGEIVSTSGYIGWINSVTGEAYSFSKRFRNLWDYVEHYIFDTPRGTTPANLEEIICYIIPTDGLIYAGGCDLADLMYIAHGTSSLDDWHVASGSYPQAVLQAKTALSKHVNGSGSIEEVWSLVKKNYQARQNMLLNYK